MWLLLLLSNWKTLTKLSRKLFINNPDLKTLSTDRTLIVTPPEAIRRQGCEYVNDPDNLEAIKRYLDGPEAGQAAEQETPPTEVTNNHLHGPHPATRPAIALSCTCVALPRS